MALVHGAQEPLGVRDGLVLYLDAANARSYPRTGLNWFDRSGNGNNGTLVNSPTYSSANGGSLVFDGVDEYANFPSGPTLGITSSTSTWTIDVWFRVNNFDLPTGANALVGVVDTHPTTDGANIIGYEKSGSNRIFYRGREAASPTIITIFGPTVALSTYYNATVVRNGTTNTQLYTNAGISSTYVGDIALTTTSVRNNVSVIATFDDVNYFSSPISVSNIKIYNRALTATEIAQNYNALKGRYGLS
jgi:hypothetical protein